MLKENVYNPYYVFILNKREIYNMANILWNAIVKNVYSKKNNVLLLTFLPQYMCCIVQ